MATLMIQGTTSDAGKSALATGLCRVLKRRGISVAPFKPQNMALNSAVTVDGGEIGRAQAVQAQACGIEAHTDMNPVLLKPNSNTGAQVIVNGHAIGDMDARSYHAFKPRVMQSVLEAHARLRGRYQVVIVEGAGSPAEINLRQGDVANMGFAESVDCPVILVADIDRGGVFAHLVGTLELISESERARIRGLVINRFRGDVSILRSGIEWLEQRTGVPVLGVLPFVEGLHLEAEDGLSGKFVQDQVGDDSTLNVVVPRFPRISNHTDFDPLLLHPRVNLYFAGQGDAVPPADLIVLPGSKSVRSDLQWMIDNGWAERLARHLRYGGRLIGICGGLQMLGRVVHDPEASEGPAGSSVGFAWLDLETTLGVDKKLCRVAGRLALPGRPACTGYEIHTGDSSGVALEKHAVELASRRDGAISEDGQIFATYLHGIFEQQEACSALLEWAGLRNAGAIDYQCEREKHIDRWADVVERHLDFNAIEKLICVQNPLAGTH